MLHKFHKLNSPIRGAYYYNELREIFVSMGNSLLTMNTDLFHTEYMKKRRVTHRRSHPSKHYLVLVRSWMLVVAFAIMLGVGAMVGQFINTQLNASSPSVAGDQIDAR